MTVNEIKPIVDLIQSLGGDAKQVLIVWLIADLMKPVLLVACLIYLSKLALSAFHSAARCENTVKAIGRMVDFNIEGYVTEGEANTIMNRLADRLAKKD